MTSGDGQEIGREMNQGVEAAGDVGNEELLTEQRCLPHRCRNSRLHKKLMGGNDGGCASWMRVAILCRGTATAMCAS